jgi:hypothetical protein
MVPQQMDPEQDERRVEQELDPSQRAYLEQVRLRSASQLDGDKVKSAEEAKDRLRNREGNISLDDTPAGAKNLAEKEEQPGGFYANEANQPKGQGKAKKGLLSSLTNRALKRWLVGIGFSAVGGVVTGLSTGVLGFMINLKEMSLDFFTKNHYSAYSQRVGYIQDRVFKEPGTNCGLSIKCRLRPGMSDGEVKRYKQIFGEENIDFGDVNGKKYIKTIRAQVHGADLKIKNVEIDGTNFQHNYANLELRSKFWATGSKPKALVYRSTRALFKFAQFHIDRSFLGKTIDKFRAYVYGGGEHDINIDRPDEKGDADKNKQLDQDLQNMNQDLETAAAKERQQMIDSNYKTGPTVTLNPDQLDGVPTDAPTVNATRTSSVKTAIDTVKGAATGVFGAVNDGCTIYSLLRAISLGAKVARYAGLILFATNFMTTADSVKAGQGDASNLSLMANALVRPSTQEGSVGKTSANSNLYSLITENKVASRSGLAYGVMGLPTLSFLLNVKSTVEKAGLNGETCKHVLAWYGQILLVGAGLVSDVLSGGWGALAGAGISLGVGVVIGMIISYVTPAIIQFLAGTVAPDLLGPGGGYAIAEAIGGGLGGFAAELGKGGLMPLTTDEAPTVFNETNQEMAKINRIEQMGKSPFSLDSPNSITSRLAMAVFPFMAAPLAQSNVQSLTSLAASPFTLLGNSVNQLFNSKVGALSTSYGGEYCADDDLLQMGIATDAYCNPVYGMPDAVLNDPQYAPEKIMDYMINNGHINEDGTPKSDDYTKFVKSCVEGTDPITPDGNAIDLTQGNALFSTPTDIDTRLCINKDEKYNMFRMYVMDENIMDGLDAAGNGTLGETGDNTGGGGTQLDNVVYYSQEDRRQSIGDWGDHPYMGSTIFFAGCGPTAMAMIVSTMTGKKVTPDQMADFFTSHGWATSRGTSWASFEQTPQSFGFKFNLIMDDSPRPATPADMEKVKSELALGHPLIASCQGGPFFCGGGHIIVIRGVAADGKFLINNPNDFVDADGKPDRDDSGKPPATTNEEWSAADMESAITGMWSYSK